MPRQFAMLRSMAGEELLFLGIDGGGSRCRARIRRGDGTVLGEALGGPSNIYQDFRGALDTIIATAGEAATCAGVKTSQLHAGLGLAGIVTSVGKEKVEDARLPFASVSVDNDAYAACMGAFGGADGGIVIAGTGSIGFALMGGERYMVGGWGFQLGDHGSGAWVGHHAVRRAALALDGLLQPTPLIAEILGGTGATRLDLSRWSEQARPKDYAQFAPAVFAAAATGDVQGMMIVIEGAAAISNLGRALLARGARSIVLLGGLSSVYPPYLDADVRRALADPQAGAVDGAIMMARRAQGLKERWS
jgi:glucosamine kinase